MFNFDHESPSLRHEQIALEEYTVPLHYGCVNIQTSKTRHISTCRCVGFLAYPSHLLQKAPGDALCRRLPASRTI
ncbi:hypothetical protein AH97_22930 [Salmonella enterica subsp. enterica]|nr:hypothetical protein [Salmonella enterica subsp. enterica serovar Hartford]